MAVMLPAHPLSWLFQKLLRLPACGDKHDLLSAEVEATCRDLAEARSRFESALEKLSQLLQVEEDHLLPLYRELRHLFEESERRANRISNHIDAIERLSEELFAEWEAELQLYRSRTLRAKSRRKLQQTRKRYRRLLAAMRQAEKRMVPVLDLFRDQVLFLKHHLNARAVDALRLEVRIVERDISELIASMDRSIQEARLLLDHFVEPHALN